MKNALFFYQTISLDKSADVILCLSLLLKAYRLYGYVARGLNFNDASAF